MGGTPSDCQEQALSVIETIRCLGCGALYSRPRQIGTAAANPGCPECSYVGWRPISAEEASPRPRFYADRLRRQPAPRR